MLRLTRTHRIKVSNRMAALAAFLLITAAVAGINSPMNQAGDAATSVVSTTQNQEQSAQASSVRSVKANRGFKASLYLFRRN